MTYDPATSRIIRQGDVTFIPVGDLTYPESHAKALSSQWSTVSVVDVPDGIIQRGEATGHDHRIEPADDKTGRRGFLKRVGQTLFVAAAGVAGARVIQSGNPGEVAGKELHHPVDLDPDTTYKVAIAREFDYANDESRWVAD